MTRENVRPALGGFCVGTVTGAAVFAARLGGGEPRTAIAGEVATMLAALALASVLETRRERSFLAAACAAVIGAWLAHRVLVATHGAPWMREAPAQLVNDAVAALATLTLVASFAGRTVRVACVLAASTLVGVYALTHAMWHVDRSPTVIVSVQRCVVAQFFSVLVGLLVHRELRVRGAS